LDDQALDSAWTVFEPLPKSPNFMGFVESVFKVVDVGGRVDVGEDVYLTGAHAKLPVENVCGAVDQGEI
jgi:hypothetical protein